MSFPPPHRAVQALRAWHSEHVEMARAGPEPTGALADGLALRTGRGRRLVPGAACGVLGRPWETAPSGSPPAAPAPRPFRGAARPPVVGVFTPCRELFHEVLLERTHIWPLGSEPRPSNPHRPLVGSPPLLCGSVFFWPIQPPPSASLLRTFAGPARHPGPRSPFLGAAGRAHLKTPLSRPKVMGGHSLSIASAGRSAVRSGHSADQSSILVSTVSSVIRHLIPWGMGHRGPVG